MKTLRNLTLPALPLLLAACGGSKKTESAGASNEEKKLNLYCWETDRKSTRLNSSH